VGNAASATMEMTNPGSSASFKVNGRLVTSTDNLVTGVIAGVNLRFNKLSESGEVINVSVAADSAPVVSAIKSFVTSYNELVTSLDSHIGEKAGALSGDFLITEIYSRLREATGMLGAGEIKSLAEIGITLEANGVMTFDPSEVSTASESRLNDIVAFLGSSTTGLASFSSSFSNFSDPIFGVIGARITSLDQTDARLSDQIATMTDRILDMQTTLLARLQAADGLLSRLESQKGMLTASLNSLNMVTNGKQQG